MRGSLGMPLVLLVTQDAPEHHVLAGDHVVIRNGRASLWRDLPEALAGQLTLKPLAVVAPPLPALLLPHPPLYRRPQPAGLWLVP